MAGENIQKLRLYAISKGLAGNALTDAQLAQSVGVNLSEGQIRDAGNSGNWENLDPLYGQVISGLEAKNQNVTAQAERGRALAAGEIPGQTVGSVEQQTTDTLKKGGYGVNAGDFLNQQQGALPSAVSAKLANGTLDDSEYQKYAPQLSDSQKQQYQAAKDAMPKFSYQDFINQQTAKNMQLVPYGQTHTQAELQAGTIDTGTGQPASTGSLQGTRSAQPSLPVSSYQGSSIVDYLRSVGQDSSFAARSKMAKDFGIANYTGTANQNLQLLGLLRNNAQALPNQKTTSVRDQLNGGINATDIGTSGGSFQSGGNSVNTSSAEVNGFVGGVDQLLAQTDAQFAAKVAQLQQDTPAEKEQSSLYERLKSKLGETAGKGTALAEAEKKATADLDKQIGDIKLQMANIKSGIAAFANQAIPTPFIVGQQREQAVTLGNLATVLLALQDNRAAAIQQADRTVELQFGDAEKEIQDIQSLLQANEGIMSKEEKKQAQSLQILLDERQRVIDQAKDDRKQVLAIASDAAKNGADTATVSAMANAKTPEEAMKTYLQFTSRAAGSTQGGSGAIGVGSPSSNAVTQQQLSPDVKGWVDLINSGRANISNVPANLKNSVASALSQTPVPTNTKAQEDAKNHVALIDQILSSSGLSGAVGPNKLARLRPVASLSGATADFLGKVQQLTSQETLNSLLNLKKAGGTLGALNESEGRMLRDAATAINSWALKDENGNVYAYKVSENTFRNELERLKKIANQAISSAGSSVVQNNNIQTMDDGTQWMQNADGSFTQVG